ncbi:galactose ABC transporter substrate-binding protein [Ruminococcaceae bacterium OttesenSCG-928-A11]|nr:galactose ABC transporter substrate-binding protein [Ruminococcaceae bacterium OttesenSCG-928-A11]
MKKFLVLLLALCMTVSLVACGGGDSSSEPAASTPAGDASTPADDTSEPAAAGEELNIGVLVWKYDDAYGSTVRTAMTKYAEQLGTEMGYTINLDMQDAADDFSKQVNQAEIMFANQPDFVIINLAEVQNGARLVDLAKEYEVPFLMYNKEPSEDTVQEVIVDTGSIFIGTTPREAGDMQGEILADLYAADPSIDLNGDGKLQYVMFVGEPSNPEAIARTKYSVETAEANGLTLERIGEDNIANWDQQQAMDQMTAILAANPDAVEVVFANNDMMGLGAVAALNAADYNNGGDKNVVVIGVDAVDPALESISQGGMTATVQQDGDSMGLANIRIAINGAKNVKWNGDKMEGDWLEGTDYQYSDDGYSVRIPYAKITG